MLNYLFYQKRKQFIKNGNILSNNRKATSRKYIIKYNKTFINIILNRKVWRKFNYFGFNSKLIQNTLNLVANQSMKE